MAYNSKCILLKICLRLCKRRPSVDPTSHRTTLTLKCQRGSDSGGSGFAKTERWDLTRGDGPYADPRIGLASGLPALGRSGPSRGFPCQIPLRPLAWIFWAECVPRVFAFRASRPAPSAAAAGAPAGAAASVPSWRRERPRGAALKPY